MGVVIELRGDGELEALLVERDRRVSEPPVGVFTAIAEFWTQSFKDNISDQHDVEGNDFAPLSEATQRERSRQGYDPASPILRRSGSLWRSIQVLESTAEVLRVGTPHEPAKLLQYGGSTGGRSRYPNRPVPPRPFIGLNDEIVEETLASLSDWYSGASEGPADA